MPKKKQQQLWHIKTKTQITFCLVFDMIRRYQPESTAIVVSEDWTKLTVVLRNPTDKLLEVLRSFKISMERVTDGCK